MDLRILGILGWSKDMMETDLAYWEEELKNDPKLDEIDAFAGVTNREGYHLIIEHKKEQINIIDEFFEEQKGERCTRKIKV